MFPCYKRPTTGKFSAREQPPSTLAFQKFRHPDWYRDIESYSECIIMYMYLDMIPGYLDRLCRGAISFLFYGWKLGYRGLVVRRGKAGNKVIPERLPVDDLI